MQVMRDNSPNTIIGDKGESGIMQSFSVKKTNNSSQTIVGYLHHTHRLKIASMPFI